MYNADFYAAHRRLRAYRRRVLINEVLAAVFVFGCFIATMVVLS